MQSLLTANTQRAAVEDASEQLVVRLACIKKKERTTSQHENARMLHKHVAHNILAETDNPQRLLHF